MQTRKPTIKANQPTTNPNQQAIHRQKPSNHQPIKPTASSACASLAQNKSLAPNRLAGTRKT
jgi:hypothetical protein